MKSDLLLCAETLLKKYFSIDCTIQSVDVLSEPERRNVILRLHLDAASNNVPPTIILKQSVSGEDDEDDNDVHARFARDWAGLEFLSQFEAYGHVIPKFYGGNQAFRFILQEDLGFQHISLVDALTASNAKEATAALGRFMQALGRMHAASFGHVSDYQRLLKELNPVASNETVEFQQIYDDLIERLHKGHQALGLTVSPLLIDEARMVAEKVLLPGPFTVLTHGDICPDNVFDHPSKAKDLQLIDFEWSFLRSALLDGTYLRMSFPTCWCAKALPKDVIQSLEKIYRQELMRTMPAAKDDTLYHEAYLYACAFWILQQTLHFILGVIEKDRVGPSGPVPANSLWKPEENTVRPRVLARLKAFVEVASKTNTLPNMTYMAGEMLSLLESKWQDTYSLEFYPAFMSGSDNLSCND